MDRLVTENCGTLYSNEKCVRLGMSGIIKSIKLTGILYNSDVEIRINSWSQTKIARGSSNDIIIDFPNYINLDRCSVVELLFSPSENCRYEIFT